MKLKNNSAAVVTVGDVHLIPGASAVEVEDSWLKHPHIKDMLKNKELEKVKEESVDETPTDQTPATE